MHHFYLRCRKRGEKEGKRERGKEGKRERGKEGKRERGKEGKRERGKEGKREKANNASVYERGKRGQANNASVYEIGSMASDKGKSIDPAVLEKQRKKGFSISSIDRLKYRTCYFTDSGVIGPKKYVLSTYQQILDFFDHKKEKKPVPIKGMDSVFSLKRLADI